MEEFCIGNLSHCPGARQLFSRVTIVRVTVLFARDWVTPDFTGQSAS